MQVHTTILRVSGLDCASCAAKLEQQIAALTGVQQAELNFGAAKLVVSHSLSAEALISAVAAAGYGARLYHAAASDPEPPWYQDHKTQLTMLAALCLGLAMLLGTVPAYEPYAPPLYILAMIAGGYYTAKAGLRSLRAKILDSNFLMIVAAIGAGAIGEWSEGATVVFLFAVGNALQAYTLDQTRQSIRSLAALAPREVLIRRDEVERKVALEEVQVGDTVIVKPGERIAIDGTVTAGSSSVNQAAVTGESMPLEKLPGSPVFAGTLNQEGTLEIHADKLAEDSTIAKIIELVEEAQGKKPPVQQFIDRFSAYYTPAVLSGAALLAVLPWLLFNQSFSDWFYRSLLLLVMSCPCALVISTPVSIVSALGNASRQGILIKGGAYLEKMRTIKALAFDKTGTITAGKPVVTDVLPADGMSAEDLLTIAAAIEARSEHPLAHAILTAAGNRPLPPLTDFQALAGFGAQGILEGCMTYIGSSRLFANLGSDLTPYTELATNWENQGKTVIYIGSATTIYGIIAVADTIRPESKAAIAELAQNGVEKIAVLTGDNQRTATYIAQQLAIDTVYSDLLPQDKAAVIEQLTAAHGSTAMVGDGINDAPALAVADIGIAMGAAGSDTALETADIALMSDNLSKLSYLIQLSHKTIVIIKQNIYVSLVIKALFIAAALAGVANLWMAVFADTGTALLVTLNGMRLMRQLK